MRRTPWLLAAVALAAVPAPAAADGLPVGNIDPGPQGVAVPGEPYRVVALTGARDTVVARVRRDDGTVRWFTRVGERLTVPGVAYDGTADGLSADGGTLVLIRPRVTWPQARTRLVVFGARRLRVRRRITLRGDFSFDALSPDGRRMFLVQYVSRRDPRRYVVRSYDLRHGRLEPGTIVDAREPDEDMRGFPVTRSTTADGRWAYTLYDGEGEPFVHALDTVERAAFCIDLPETTKVEWDASLTLSRDESTLTVRTRAGDTTTIDTGKLEVR